MTLFQGRPIHFASLPWAALYGVSLTISMYSGFKALSVGPIALTSIMASMSLIIPFFWGLAFWGEHISIPGILGISMLVCAIILICYQKQGATSFKWLFYSITTMICNGICSVMQKYHQLQYPGMYQTDFMLLSTGIVALILLVLGFIKNSNMKPNFLGMVSGAANGLANLFVLLLAATQNAAILFPLIAAGNVLTAWLAGVILFREKLKKRQFIGLFIGIFGVIALNL
jgi:drug/metabolite transporter (DMT)-like permease